jgi:membrane protein DedA with SNARE-associated domain
LLRRIANVLIAFGPLGVFVLGFIDSIGVPLPAAIDALMLGVAIETPDRAYFTALMAVLGSTGGNLILFHLARSGGRRFIQVEPPLPGKRQKFQRWFHRYGLLTVFIPAVVPFVPLPLKVFVVSAGAMHTPAGKFLAVILLARTIRYFGEAYLGIRLGGGAQFYLRQNAWTIAGAALAIALAAVALIQWSNGKTKES